MTTRGIRSLSGCVSPVDGVAGNSDGPELHERFGTRRVLELGGARVGLTPGHLGSGATTPARAQRAFADEPPGSLDVIVLGHLHIPVIDRRPDGTWLLNPGSPTDRRRQPLYSWALLTIEGGEVTSPSIATFADCAPVL